MIKNCFLNSQLIIFYFIGSIAMTVDASSQAEDTHLGLIEYEIACLLCHGIEARGDGHMVSLLKIKPTDLTSLSAKNNGTYPMNEITEIIDGRKEVVAHGRRTMPVWGERYRLKTSPDESTEIIENRAIRRIEALVNYLASIQEP